MPNTHVVASTGTYTDSRTGLRYRAEAGKLIDVTNAYYLGMPGAVLPDDAWEPCNHGPGPTVASTYTVPTTAIYQDSRNGIRYRAEAGAVIAMVTAYHLGMPDTALPDDYWQPCADELPIPTAGLALRLDASTLAGADASAVASWPDASGNGYPATQATAAKRPTKRTGILNGKSVVRFDGGDGFVTPAVDLTGTSGVSLYLVASAVGAAAAVLIETAGMWFTVPTGFNLETDAGGGIHANLYGNVGAASATVGTLGSTPTLIAAVFDKTLATNETALWVDDVAAPAGGGANNTNAFGANTLSIGARDNAITEWFAGDLAEVLLYGVAHSPAQRGEVEDALREKWGL